jgi:hypothetical protein
MENEDQRKFIGEKMKNKNWLKYTIGILLTLIVLTVVAGAGYHVGRMQSVNFARVGRDTHPSFTHEGNNIQGMPGNFQRGNMPQNFQRQASGNDLNFQPNHRGFPSHFPVFGLIQFVILALLLWVVYKLVKNSGWRLSLTRVSPAPAPVTDMPAAAEVKKEEIAE